ncbi:diacylglycerol kinase [Ligilactobacillus pobuzihii]|nr:diacylglycerol kinase family protein [Ligilactobacillus pobuzihii]GEN47336.1 diacylglycerol kinase [Ligilactobacillus pobuzihii]
MLMVLKDKKKYSTKWKNRSFLQAFKHANEGLRTVYHDERNFRFDCWAGLLVVLSGFILNVSNNEWRSLLLAVFLVLASEAWNTVIENIVDLVCGTKHQVPAKKAKDIAAGAVLLSSLYAVFTAAMILLPKIWHIFFN